MPIWQWVFRRHLTPDCPSDAMHRKVRPLFKGVTVTVFSQHRIEFLSQYTFSCICSRSMDGHTEAIPSQTMRYTDAHPWSLDSSRVGNEIKGRPTQTLRLRCWQMSKLDANWWQFLDPFRIASPNMAIIWRLTDLRILLRIWPHYQYIINIMIKNKIKTLYLFGLQMGPDMF